MTQFSLKKQLLVMVSIIATGFFSFASFSGFSLFQLASDLTEIGESTELQLGKVYTLLENSALIQSRVQVILNLKDPDLIEKEIANLEELQKKTRSEIEECGEACTKISNDFEEFVKKSTSTIETYLTGNSADAFAALASEMSPVFSGLQTSLRTYSQDVSRSISQKNKETSEEANLRVILTMLICGIASATIVYIGLMFRKNYLQG